MSSKFSQSSDVQTLPPVCRSTTVLPIPWEAPPYPPINGFCHMQLEHFDHTVEQHKTKIQLTRTDPNDHWSGNVIHDAYNLYVQIHPRPNTNDTLIETILIIPHPEFWVPDWTGPPWIDFQRWASGQNTLYMPPSQNWIWQTFAAP